MFCTALDSNEYFWQLANDSIKNVTTTKLSLLNYSPVSKRVITLVMSISLSMNI